LTLSAKRVLVTGMSFIIAAVVLFPFYIMIVMSTYSTTEIFRGLHLLPGSYLLQNVVTVFKGNFLLFYWNSLYVAALASLGAVIVSAMAGYAFSKFSFRGKDAIFKICLATMMVPSQLGLIAFAWQINKMGMNNTHLPLIIPAMASMFGVFFMSQYMKNGLPDEIIESARIDGCGEMAMFWRMVTPLVAPASISLGLLFFLWSWNSYLVPLVVISRGQLYTVPLGIKALRLMYRVDYGGQITGLSIGTLPIVILFLVFSKNFISGLTAAAIKG